MKKLFFCLLAAEAIIGCKKSTTTPLTAQLNGKYYSFKLVDTIYSPVTPSVRTVLIETSTVDTFYQYTVATKQLSAPSFQPDAGRFIPDTISFTTAGGNYFVNFPAGRMPAETWQYNSTTGQINVSGQYILTTSDPTVIGITTVLAEGIGVTYYKKL